MDGFLDMADYQNTSVRPLRRERLKVSTACQACRLRKGKCDGGRPGIHDPFIIFSYQMFL